MRCPHVVRPVEEFETCGGGFEDSGPWEGGGPDLELELGGEEGEFGEGFWGVVGDGGSWGLGGCDLEIAREVVDSGVWWRCVLDLFWILVLILIFRVLHLSRNFVLVLYLILILNCSVDCILTQTQNWNLNQILVLI